MLPCFPQSARPPTCVFFSSFSPAEPRMGHCVSRSLKETARRPNALAASRVSAMPVAAVSPWRTKCDAMPGLHPKENTEVRPVPFEKAASLASSSRPARSSVMSGHTSNPLFMKCTPRDLTSFQMVCVSMRVASSISTSPAVMPILSSRGMSVSRVTKGAGLNSNRPSTLCSLISGAK